MNIHTKKGYIIIEAAIVLPLFIIAVLTVGLTMKNIYYTETASFIARSEAAELAKNAYVMPVSVTFPMELEKKITEELPEVKKIEVRGYKYRFAQDGENELISFTVAAENNSVLPVNLIGEYEIRSAFLFRGFCGKDNSKSTSFSSFESDIEAEKVYVFPENGTKYHTKNCSYVNSYPLKTLLSKKTKKDYKSCGICESQNAREGSSIYVFEYGQAYHTANCNSVNKYVICMDRRDAAEKGYTACIKCGGI